MMMKAKHSVHFDPELNNFLVKPSLSIQSNPHPLWLAQAKLFFVKYNAAQMHKHLNLLFKIKSNTLKLLLMKFSYVVCEKIFQFCNNSSRFHQEGKAHFIPQLSSQVKELLSIYIRWWQFDFMVIYCS